MKVPTIFETSVLRSDVRRGTVTESNFAVDIVSVQSGTGSKQCRDPNRFSANTYPMGGFKNLLANLCRRLSGHGGEVASTFRPDASYGGGKTHGLIALMHAARGMQGVSDPDEFIESTLLPAEHVPGAVFNGENADPVNGQSMGWGVRAHTPRGEIAYALAGVDAYQRVRRRDEKRVAPGAETLRELFGGEPTLIILDKLCIYLHKVPGLERGWEQLTAILTSLFKAIESTPSAALVITLAISKQGTAMDTYQRENQYVTTMMTEPEKVEARKVTVLTSTQEDETVRVFRRRLFQRIDEGSAAQVADSYPVLWTSNSDSLPSQATRFETVDSLRKDYPLHPAVLDTVTRKTATLANPNPSVNLYHENGCVAIDFTSVLFLQSYLIAQDLALTSRFLCRSMELYF